MAEAIFAGGCFWCTEAVFRGLAGVTAVESGYIGGHAPDPTYKQVCSGATHAINSQSGHAGFFSSKKQKARGT
jgi:peptide methionine sulfoxide reductase MsrA